MKKYKFWIISFLVVFTATAINAQIADPVTWTATAKKKSDSLYTISFKAEIEAGWHVYSQFIEGEEGPIPTEFNVEATKGIAPLGKTTEPKGITAFDKTFDMQIKYFEEEAIFTQDIKVTEGFEDPINASVFFMVCNDERCLPPEEVGFTINLKQNSNNKLGSSSTKQILDPVEWETSVTKIDETTFEINFNAKAEAGWHFYSQTIEGGDDVIKPIPSEFNVTANGLQKVGATTEPEGITKFDKTFQMKVKYFEGQATFVQRVTVDKNYKDPAEASVFYTVCNDERCLAPEEKLFNVYLVGKPPALATANQTQLSEKDLNLSQQLKIPLKTKEFVLSTTEKKGLWKLFFLGFLGGFIALLTPCVFPMIPLTVSFFSHSSGSSRQGVFKAFLYGFFIFLVYILVSVPFHILDSANPDMLNNVSTNTWLNVVFFVIFIAFAISFFGYFEITLPSKWSNAMDSKATKMGGILGVFFMALTLALVSFSCTGPILGSLLGGSLTNDGGAMQLTYGLAGFGLALALPFAFFALFPNLLQKLPKSGGWMTTVKVVLGFIELAFAFKFLSNADLVEHWGVLKREIFVGIWILIFLGLAAYLFGFIRFPHDNPNAKISLSRRLLGVVAAIFAGYLVTGIVPTEKSNLKLLSGFPPPLFYSIYTDEDSPEAHFGVNTYTSFEEGLAAAQRLNKPILIDFTGWACVNCRKMEEQVWVKPAVSAILKNEVILVSLYVDDRKDLPEADRFIYQYPNSTKSKKIKTIGDKWAAFQTINFKNNSQPYYVLLDADFNLLETPVGYTPNSETYVKWLKSGLSNFKK